MPPRPPKRQKVTQDLSSEDNKHEAFTQWALNRGVMAPKVRPQSLPRRGLGLLATDSIAEDETILFVPEKAMYKPDVKLLKQQKLDSASPQAQLAVSAMAICKASDSPFAFWESTWPANQDFMDSLPLCWSKSDQDLLPPPIQQPLQRQFSDYQKDWTSVRKYCEGQGWTEEDFRYYWMIIDSRSFHWKPAKGSKPGSMVMCPFIDYMNHGPSGTTCNVFQRPNGYEVVADREYGKSCLSLSLLARFISAK
jgi:hypothetical protein